MQYMEILIASTASIACYQASRHKSDSIIQLVTRDTGAHVLLKQFYPLLQKDCVDNNVKSFVCGLCLSK